MVIMMLADCYAPLLMGDTVATACCTCVNSQSLTATDLLALNLIASKQAMACYQERVNI